jgi:MATE family multidrug resistance protein
LFSHILGGQFVRYNKGVNNNNERIWSLSLPMIGGMLSQNILNLVDTLMIGKLSPIALGGSGIGTFLFFIFFIGFTGLSSGVQTITARLTGKKANHQTPIPLVLGIKWGVGISIIVTALTLLSSKFLTGLFSTDPMISGIGNDYLRFRILGLPFFSLCLVIRGFWNGIGTPMRYVKGLIFMHSLNILFNYTLIFGHFGLPPMGAAGAGLGSTLALAIGSLFYLVDARKSLQWNIAYHRRHQQWLLTLSIPIAAQQIIFSGGYTCFYWILSQIGPNAMAIGTVLVNIILIVTLPGVGFGMATLSLVSQSLGKKNFTEAFEWPNHVFRLSMMTIGTIAVLMAMFPITLLTPFISDKVLLESAIIPLRMDCIGVLFEVGAIIYMDALNGADQTRMVALGSSILHWVFYLPMAYLIGIQLNYGINGIWAMTVVFQIIQFMLFTGIWQFRFKSFTQPPMKLM